jgi:3-oxoacyl-[acyl-carrier-protein] synthase-3
MFTTCHGLKIIGTGTGLPQASFSNEALWPETSDWVKSNLGISERRMIADNESLLDLCLQAANQALAKAGIDGSKLDAIIIATSTPDQVNPSMASILHGKLKASSNCMSLDIQAVCAGFIYGLSLVSSMIASKSGKYFLLIGADQFSSITDFNSRDCVFFGDGAAAMLIEATDQENKFGVEVFTEGQGWESFHTPNQSRKFQMDARDVSSNASRKLPNSVQQICARLGITVDQVSQFFTHQPSKGVLDKFNAALGLTSSKTFRNLDKRGNTAGATVPLVFHESGYFDTAKPGDFICFSAIGSGWVWGSAILEWPHD